MDNKQFISLIRCTLASLSLIPCLTATAQQSQDSIQYGGWEEYRVGGYGEIHTSFKDYGTNRFYGGAEGNAKEKRNTISIPRFVIAADYKFSPKWILGMEIEFESGGTGTAYELENTENGEYETEIERGGEVAIEQFHITRLIDRSFNVRAGHIIVPIGQNNAHHEPITFFGTSRPEGETTIIPNTWHETGLEFFGTLGRGHATFDYQLLVVSGLNANGFDRNNWAGEAKQGIFEEENFTSPGYAAKVAWRGIDGLRIGAGFYYCRNTGSNADKSQTYDGIGTFPVRIYNLEAEYRHRCFEVRANGLWGNLTNSDVMSKKNTMLSNKSPYSRITPIAHKAVAYGGEAGLNLRTIVNDERMPCLIPFVRYEYYNAQQDVLAPYNADDRLKTSLWTAGINYRPLPQLVIKADYTSRRIGDGKYNSENEFALAVAWTGWLWSK